MTKLCCECRTYTDNFYCREGKLVGSVCYSCKNKKHRERYKVGHPDLHVPDTKECSKCGKAKKSSFFYSDRRRKDGKQSQCKDCQKKYRTSQTLEYNLFRMARERARNKDVPFSISQEDIVIPEKCPVLGIPLKKGEGKLHPGSPTLDRIVPSLGYIPDNIIVMSHRANTMKSDATLEEVEKLCAWMRCLL